MLRSVFLILTTLYSAFIFSQTLAPSVYSNISTKKNGRVLFNLDGKKLKSVQNKFILKKAFGDKNINLSNLKSIPFGTKKGLEFDFKNNGLTGTLYYGFIKYEGSKLPQIVYVNKSSKIKKGKTNINILDNLSAEYDIVNWQVNSKGTLGYRITDEKGNYLYEGRVSFKGTGPFTVDKTIIEGPFVNRLTTDEVTISFETNLEIVCNIEIDNKKIQEEKPSARHAIKISGLSANKEYSYKINYGDNSQSYTFQTPPSPGSRTSFSFGYASDSRKGGGGADRDFYGVNSFVMKKIMATIGMSGVSFMQFTGDLINGYNSDAGKQNLQYANWKKSIEPFASYIPVYTGIGNHELLHFPFLLLKDYKSPIMIDRFPFETESMEACFASNFVNPLNGPSSEDGAVYDPDSTKTDFPSYCENVYYYTYDNVAMIVLNSDYLYTPQLLNYPQTSGNLHGYIMDKQLEWLKNILAKFENDKNIDHVFITLHTPIFPNGGHSHDDMWYNGNNDPRPIIAGKPLKKGIIERRDELLDLIVNKNKKVLAVLCGDEHNYSRMTINNEMSRYPENYKPEKITLSRSVCQITNGAAGAPYYAQEQLPWTKNVSFFTPQYAVVIFYVNGQKVKIEVLNPDTLELLEEAVLKE